MIPHSQPYFDAADEAAVKAVLKDRFVTHGPRAQKLGAMGAALLGQTWGIAVQSGTDALTACFRILGHDLKSAWSSADVPPEASGPIIIPAYMCSAPLDAIALTGATCDVVDIRRETLAIDPDRVNAHPKADTVLGSHMFGIPAMLAAIDAPNLVEDCAQTLGVLSAGRRVGSAGRLSVCSFFGTKLAAAGHGGLLAGHEPELKAAAEALFHHDKNEAWSPHLHFAMSDLNAALAISQLQQLPAFIAARRGLAACYADALGGGPILSECAYSRFLVATDDADPWIGRFQACGIEAKRPVYKPVYQLLGLPDAQYPEARWVHDHIVSVPLYPGMPADSVDRILCFLKDHARALRCWPPG